VTESDIRSSCVRKIETAQLRQSAQLGEPAGADGRATKTEVQQASQMCEVAHLAVGDVGALEVEHLQIVRLEFG
jgi:hypothetical protein